jgi:hypothetical protein
MSARSLELRLMLRLVGILARGRLPSGRLMTPAERATVAELVDLLADARAELISSEMLVEARRLLEPRP